jgi:two-component system, NarL family, nitrate/nitrite response regulator NarL
MVPSDRRIRVVIADDSRTALNSVCGHLESDGRFEIVGTAFNGVHLVSQTRRCKPDLVLTDLSMPQMNGLEAALALRKLFPKLRIVIFSELKGLSIREECQRNGADGFVDKEHMPEKLMEEIFRLFPDVPASGQPPR